MTGARVVVRVDDLLVGGALGRLQKLGGRPASLMNPIGMGMAENVRDRFDRGVDPEGRPWVGLNPAYAAMKRGPGILRESGMRGGLQASITFKVMGASLLIGSNKVYAAVHQFGATIVPKNGKALVFKLVVFSCTVTKKWRFTSSRRSTQRQRATLSVRGSGPFTATARSSAFCPALSEGFRPELDLDKSPSIPTSL